MRSPRLLLLDLHLTAMLLLAQLPARCRGTKIIDYDNVVENPYYRKSNLELLIRRQCQFLQVKTEEPHTDRTVASPFGQGKFSNKLKEAFSDLGINVNSKDDLHRKLTDGLVNFIRATNPNHELCSRNLTDVERSRLNTLLPYMIEKIEMEDLNGDDNLYE